MPERVLSALLEAWHSDLLPEGATVLLAVSGGADSLALLHGAAETAARTGWSLAVGHVHHGWRGREADRDADFVGEHARRLGRPFHFRAADALGLARSAGLSREAAARQVRYEALREMARAAGASRIATAHQSNDRVESYLLARRRRGGVASLAGPRRLREDGVARPLLHVSRGEIEAFLAARGISWRRDASNGDLSLARNRVRRELAALVADRGRRAFDELLALADAAAAERDRVETEFDETLRARIDLADGRATADAEALRAAARDVQRVAVERMARPFGRPGRAPLTGVERERLLDRLAAGGDFRFEAGRRIRFRRQGPLFSAWLARTQVAGRRP